MLAFSERVGSRASVPSRLQHAAAFGYVVGFALLAAYGRPGSGLGQLFFVPIVLVALAGNPRAGAVAGLAAAALYASALLVQAPVTRGVLVSPRIGIHVVSYVAAGMIVGAFASRTRELLAESRHMMDVLLEHLHRDLGSGALDARGLDAAIARRVGRQWPFALLLGELDAGSGGRRRSRDADALAREAMRLVSSELGPDVEQARAGLRRLAVLAPATSASQARDAAVVVERDLASNGLRATFGWAFFPADGEDGLSLVQAASERLHARRLVRGEWTPTAASAGLVDPLVTRRRPAG